MLRVDVLAEVDVLEEFGNEDYSRATSCGIPHQTFGRVEIGGDILRHRHLDRTE
jgi:hypothetical protein